MFKIINTLTAIAIVGGCCLISQEADAGNSRSLYNFHWGPVLLQSASSPMKARTTRKAKSKGYGFIQPDNGGKDVFVHISAVEKSKKKEGGRHTPFFSNYRPQFYFRTTDVTGGTGAGAADGLKTKPESSSPGKFYVRPGTYQFDGYRR